MLTGFLGTNKATVTPFKTVNEEEVQNDRKYLTLVLGSDMERFLFL